ncbi:ImmA/IrrE family metallo-endopeptidase [Sedimentibacter sp.]|uniref:ImmA/IrrE family metallo-endopeptidase n=1 Tax=Sedimentibacter sp. TaxID=1960295 RepID=UPI0028976A7A|nr:ImmA/IrrE family metallo-endopeptidase [Sedimentibacter sp.]
MDKLDLCTKALSLRKELGEDTTSPIDIFSLAHTITKLTLVFYPMGNHLSGMCIKNNGNPVIAINSSMSAGRQHFSMAHELYHLYFDENRQTTVSAIKIGVGNDTEKAADRFASYFLMPPVALSELIKKIHYTPTEILGIKEIVKLEQYFGLSRQALLYRLIEDNKLTIQQAEQFRQGVIRSAVNLGYDDTLYKPLPEDKQYKTYGYYIQQAEELLQKDLISTGKYEQLLLTAFRPDLVYGDEFEGSELND